MLDGIDNVNIEVKEQVGGNMNLLEAMDVGSAKRIDELKDIVAPVVGVASDEIKPIEIVQPGVTVVQQVQPKAVVAEGSLGAEVVEDDSDKSEVLIDGPFGVEIKGINFASFITNVE